MPVVDGTNLRWFQRDGTLTLGDVIDIGIQLAAASKFVADCSALYTLPIK
jgi:hypothetical protein